MEGSAPFFPWMKHPTKCKPPQDAPIIIIPINLDNVHWVMLVRKRTGKEVNFFLIDNLYDEKIEVRIKWQMFGRGPDEWLCPEEASWKNCKTHTKMLHSNECGPRELLHGMVITMHPDANEETLENHMHQDLAKISQDFIAKSVVSGRIYMRSLQGIPRNNEPDKIIEEESNKEEEEGTEDRAEGREEKKPKPERNKEKSTRGENSEQKEPQHQEMKNIAIERQEIGRDIEMLTINDPKETDP